MTIPHDVYAAVLVPRDPGGNFIQAGFRGILTFLRDRGIHRVALNGATGEYCLTTPDELRTMLAIGRGILGEAGTVLCGIGAASLPRAIELGRIAVEGQAQALLAPMPHFFPYAQEDLDAFCRSVAAEFRAPVILYNLPAFTTALQLETVRSLVSSVPNIIGIKDSSGSTEILEGLNGISRCRIVGDDRVLVEALAKGCCDAVVSGVAGVLPELIRFLFHQRQSPDARLAAVKLQEYAQHLSSLPVPWGLKLTAECRGIAAPSILQPLSGTRQKQAVAFREWFAAWWPPVETLVRQS